MTGRRPPGRQHGEGADRTLVRTLVGIGLIASVVSSLGSPLVPTIAATDHVSLVDAQWALTIALLVGAVAAPTMGRLGDGPHRRRVVLVALVTVALGCLLAALPLGYPFLLTGRALQGVGLGLIPLAMAIVRTALSPERARAAVAMLSVTTVGGIGLGYPLTGLLADSLGFHAAFWFGALASAGAFVAAVVVLPVTAARPAPSLDLLGALLLGGAVSGLLLALSEGGLWGWTSAPVLGLTGGGLVLLGWWIRHELRTPSPLIDLRLMRNRGVLTADITGVFAGVGVYLLNSTVVRFVQTPTGAGYGFGTSILVAGLVLLPFSLTSVAASKVAPRIARRTSPELVLPIGCGIFVVAFLMFALARTQLWEVFVMMGIAGLGVGCTFAAMPGLIVRAVPVNETGSAMSFNNVLRFVGYAAGSALSGTVLQAHTKAGSALPAGSGYGTAAVLGMGVWALAAVVSFLLPGRNPVRGRLNLPTYHDVDEPVVAVD